MGGVERAALVLPFLVVACSTETLPLDPGSTKDAGVAVDAGQVRDAGSRDAGSVVRDAGVTRDGGPVDFCAPATGRFGFPQSDLFPGSWQGIARITSLSPFVFVMEATGDRFEVPFDPPEPLVLAPQSMLAWVRLQVVRPFWTETKLVVHDLDPQEGPGSVLFAAWEGSAFDTDPELGIRYTDNPCVVGPDSCGDNRGLDLVVDIDANRTVMVPYGTEHETDDGWILNAGSSSRYRTGPTCPDTPGAWYKGFVVAARFPALRCRELNPDTCISVGGCALFGDELMGSGYRCEPAITPCEALPSREQCQLANACSWTSGGCYCPEREVCACAGGPPPRCRSLCGAAGCPSTTDSQRYCMVPTMAPPACAPPVGEATCDWRPPNCGGATGPTQCACVMGTPMTFANDCERRLAGGGPGVFGACP